MFSSEVISGAQQVVLEALVSGLTVASAESCTGGLVAGAITGIAGPTGEEPGKPVGTVWFGINSNNFTHTVCKHFSGNREQVREAAVLQALKLIHEAIVKA